MQRLKRQKLLRRQQKQEQKKLKLNLIMLLQRQREQRLIKELLKPRLKNLQKRLKD